MTNQFSQKNDNETLGTNAILKVVAIFLIIVLAIQLIRRAALSVHLNIAEGASRKSEAERKRYFEISRGSIIEIDAAIDIANDLDYLINYNIENVGTKMILCFRLLTGLINQKVV